jgi:hypothetical protein
VWHPRLDRWRRTLRPHALFLAADGLWDLGPTPALRFVDFAAWCAAHPAARCRLFVSSHHLHLVDSDPDLALRSDAAVNEHARAQLVHYHGAAAEHWPLAAWRSGGHRGATALHGLDLDALRAAAGAHRVRLLGVHPWWLAAWRWALARHPERAAAENTRLLLVEGALATQVHVQSGSLRSAVVMRLAGPRNADLQALIADLADAADGAPVVVHGHGIEDGREAGLSGSAPDPLSTRPPRSRPGAAPAPDLLDPRPAPALAWVAAGAAVLALVAAAADTLQARAELQVATDATVAQAAPAEAAPAPGLLALQAALGRPWPRIFAAAEAASLPGVRWLVMDQGGGDLRLEGLAPDADTALKVATALAAQPGVQNAVVSRVLAVEGDGTGAGGVRFELLADLAGPMRAAP